MLIMGCGVRGCLLAHGTVLRAVLAELRLRHQTLMAALQVVESITITKPPGTTTMRPRIQPITSLGILPP